MNKFKIFLTRHLMRPTIIRIIIISFFLLFLFACQGGGATGAGTTRLTYYVKAGGNDFHDGLSDSAAWATIPKVQATVKSGDTVYFRSQDTWTSATPPVLTATAGVTYDGSTYGSGTRATLQATGDANLYPNYSVVKIEASNVTFKGFNVDMDSKKTGGIYIGYMCASNTTNVTIDNCVVHDSLLGPTDWAYGILVSNKLGYTVSNISITNSTVYNHSHEGIAVYAGWANAADRNDTVLIRGNTVYNCGTGVLIANDSDNVIVEYNNLYENTSQGIYMRVSPPYEGYVTSGPDAMIIRYNIIRDTTIAGILIGNPRNVSMGGAFYGNLIYNNGKNTDGNVNGADFIIAGVTGYTYPGNVFNIYNNTFYSIDKPLSNYAFMVGIGVGGDDPEGITVNFKNNIVYYNTAQTGSNRYPIWDRYNRMTHSNNLVYRSSSASDTHVMLYAGADVLYYNRAGGASDITNWETSAQKSDPAFTGGTLPTGFTGTYGTNMVPNTNYFAITSGDALNNGATLGSLYNGCINGAGLATPIIRPEEGAYDIGAYEYIGNYPPVAPERQLVK